MGVAKVLLGVAGAIIGAMAGKKMQESKTQNANNNKEKHNKLENKKGK